MDKYWPSGKARRKAPSDWSGKDIYAKARDAGVDFELRYRDEYVMGSLFVHSGVASTDNIPAEGLVNAYALGHTLFQESYLKATVIVCKAFRLLQAKPGLRNRLQELECVHKSILTQILIEKDGVGRKRGRS